MVESMKRRVEMPKPLPKETRENIIRHHKNGAKNTEISKWLRVSSASVERIIRLYREGKSIEVKAYKRGRKPAFDEVKMKHRRKNWSDFKRATQT